MWLSISPLLDELEALQDDLVLLILLEGQRVRPELALLAPAA
jgi:hypothetical protein